MGYFKTEKLSVGYHNRVVVNDISIDINKGEILTLIGPNGSGKSTILKSITRQLQPISGVVVIDEQNVIDIKQSELAKNMALLLTERIDVELLKCRDVVSMGRYPYTGRFGILSNEDEEIVKYAMELVDIYDLRDRDYREISDGQRQRVMLARAICQEPEILILDEPTSFLDIKYKIQLMKIIKELSREKNTTVIMSLHELEYAEDVSDKILGVKGEATLYYGSVDEVFSKDIIMDLYSLSEDDYTMLFKRKSRL